MIKKRTVFILGAGASCPYGFPTASGLRDDIIGRFRKDYGNHVVSLRDKDWVHRGYPDMSIATTFLNAFDTPNTTESIDLFLSRQPRFKTIGKLAILLSILRREGESRFGNRMREPRLDWYSHLYGEMTRELIGKEGYAEFGRNRVTFVTFNYDRSLEDFLFRSLSSFEGATAPTIKEQIDQIGISHVYGKVSPLPWQDGDSSTVLEYGADDSKSFGRLPSMVQNLYAVHEERTNPELEKARTAISEAERIFFLGFGYAKENLEVLGLPRVLKPQHLIYGTALNRIPREVKDIETIFVHGLQQSAKGDPLNWPGDARARVKIQNCDSVALLRESLMSFDEQLR